MNALGDAIAERVGELTGYDTEARETGDRASVSCRGCAKRGCNPGCRTAEVFHGRCSGLQVRRTLSARGRVLG